jgi:acyl-CoA reductase-like NAD-dependent aldehyde dehydrogenase
LTDGVVNYLPDRGAVLAIFKAKSFVEAIDIVNVTENTMRNGFFQN